MNNRFSNEDKMVVVKTVCTCDGKINWEDRLRGGAALYSNLTTQKNAQESQELLEQRGVKSRIVESRQTRGEFRLEIKMADVDLQKIPTGKIAPRSLLQCYETKLKDFRRILDTVSQQTNDPLSWTISQPTGTERLPRLCSDFRGPQGGYLIDVAEPRDDISAQERVMDNFRKIASLNSLSGNVAVFASEIRNLDAALQTAPDTAVTRVSIQNNAIPSLSNLISNNQNLVHGAVALLLHKAAPHFPAKNLAQIISNFGILNRNDAENILKPSKGNQDANDAEPKRPGHKK